MKRVVIVTGTRAEYGILTPVLKAIENKPELRLMLVVTGMHLSQGFGNTIQEIEKDGYKIDARVDMSPEGDTLADMAKSIGAGIIGMALGFIPISLIDKYSKSWGSYISLTICLTIVYFAGHNYFTQMFSTILTLFILYIIGLKVNLSQITNMQIILLGQYSLAGYILQIVFLKFYFSFIPLWTTNMLMRPCQ